MMLRIAVHLEPHLHDRPFAARWSGSRSLGYQGGEFNWRAHDAAEAVQLRAETGLEVTCMGGATGGVPGAAGRPSLISEADWERLTTDVDRAIGIAQSLGCKNLVMVPASLQAGWSEQRYHDEMVATLRMLAPRLEQGGVNAAIEPLNSRVDHKDCWCDTRAKAFAVVEAVGSPAVKVLYDLYHMAVMGDDLVSTIRRHHDLITYYHVAGVPGRHEPDAGEVDYRPVFDAIASTGYSGYVGLEYGPSLPPVESLQRVRVAFPDRD